VQPYVGNTNVAVSHTVIGKGSWIHIDHAGVGFSAVGASQAFSITYKGIGTIRNQPTPNGAAAWAPNANDYDFFNSNADLYMDDVFCLNPTKFSFTTGGGRAIYHRVRGQPLLYGIWTDTAFDVCHYDYVHFWPWWSQAQGVYNYMQTNAYPLITARNDNPNYSNIFAYQYLAGMLFTSNVNGNTSRLQGTNIDFDACQNGIVLDGSVGSVTAEFANFNHQGLNSLTVASCSIFTQPGSAACQLSFVNSFLGGVGANCVRVDGSGTTVRMTHTRAAQWNANTGGTFAAFTATAGNTLKMSDCPQIDSPGSGVILVNGAGKISIQIASGIFDGTTDGSGSIAIPHGTALTPRGAVISLNGAAIALIVQPTGFDATNVYATVYRPTTGATFNTSAVQVSWEAFY
jgi:hypothetical protein